MTIVVGDVVRNWRVQLGLGVGAAVIGLHVGGFIDAVKVLRDFQGLFGTLIAGSIGFWSVNKTLTTNADNARNQKAQDIDHERDVVRVAVLAELVVLHKDITAKQSAARAVQAVGNYVVPKHFDGGEFSRAYRAVLPKIGLLGVEEVEAVVRAHSEHEGCMEMGRFLEDIQLQSTNQREPALFELPAAADEPGGVRQNRDSGPRRQARAAGVHAADNTEQARRIMRACP